MKKVVINYKDLTKKEKVFYWIRKIATGILYVAILVSLTIASIYSLMHNSSDSESSVISASAETSNSEYTTAGVSCIADYGYYSGTEAYYYCNLYRNSLFCLTEQVDDYVYYYSSISSVFTRLYDYIVTSNIRIYLCNTDGLFAYEGSIHIVDVDTSNCYLTFDTSFELTDSKVYGYIVYADYLYYTSFPSNPVYLDDGYSGAVISEPNFAYITLSLYNEGSGYPLTMFIPTAFFGVQYDMQTMFFRYNGATGYYLGNDTQSYVDDSVFSGSFETYDYFVYSKNNTRADVYTGYEAIYEWVAQAGYDLDSYSIVYSGFIDGDTSKSVSLSIIYVGNEEFYIDFSVNYGYNALITSSGLGYDLNSEYCSGGIDIYANSFLNISVSNAGYSEGYTDGYNTGFTDGMGDGYDSGYSAGFTDGVASCDGDYSEGYASGYSYGYNDGSADGYALGKTNGYGLGVDDGYSWGYEVGFSDAGLEAWSAPGVTLLNGVAEIFEVKIFGYFSLGTFVQIFIYMFVVLMFIRMFSG